MKGILLDTCVWISNYNRFEPTHEAARSLIVYCVENEIPLFYSVASPQNIEYILQRYLKQIEREKNGGLSTGAAQAISVAALAVVDHMAEIATAVGVDESDLWIARKLAMTNPELEDCIVMAGMERSGAEFLVTEDERMIRHSPFPTMSPKDMLSHFENCPPLFRR